MGTFGSDLRKIAEARKLDLETVSRGFTLRLFDAVVRDTRVDTGRLRGNWNAATGTIDRTTTEAVDKRPGGGLRSEMRAKVSPLALNTLSNSLPYAVVWEEKDGMIARAVADFERLLRAEVEALK